jgi:hypothetical protein
MLDMDFLYSSSAFDNPNQRVLLSKLRIYKLLAGQAKNISAIPYEN